MSMTENGRIILDMVSHADSHPTAEDIYCEIRAKGVKMSMATVYNNLNSLCNEGQIRRVAIDGAADRYDKVARHDHLVCSSCGKITDLMLDDMTDIFAKSAGITPDSYDLKLFYICDECRKKRKKDA